MPITDVTSSNLGAPTATRSGARFAVARSPQDADTASLKPGSLRDGELKSGEPVLPALGTNKDASSEDVGADEVEQLNVLIQEVRRELKFSVDGDTGATIIKVFDANTRELVRQIPAEEVVELMNHLQQQGHSLLVDVTA